MGDFRDELQEVFKTVSMRVRAFHEVLEAFQGLHRISSQFRGFLERSRGDFVEVSQGFMGSQASIMGLCVSEFSKALRAVPGRFRTFQCVSWRFIFYVLNRFYEDLRRLSGELQGVSQTFLGVSGGFIWIQINSNSSKPGD